MNCPYKNEPKTPFSIQILFKVRSENIAQNSHFVKSDYLSHNRNSFDVGAHAMRPVRHAHPSEGVRHTPLRKTKKPPRGRFFLNSDDCYLRSFLAIRIELVSTDTLDIAIANEAMMGFRRPNAASGISTAL